MITTRTVSPHISFSQHEQVTQASTYTLGSIAPLETKHDEEPRH